MSRVTRLIKAGIRADRNRIKRDIKVAFPVNWPSRWALPILVFLLSSFFMYGDLGNNETKIALGLIKDNTSNWNYLTQEGQLYRFITYSIIHQNLMHYVGNMVNLLGIWAITIIDKHKRIEITYIVAVILGGLAQSHFTPATRAVGIGASAGIMGLSGLYVYKRIEKKEYLLALLFLSVCMINDLTLISQKSSIAWIAHWFGLLIGIAFGIINSKTIRKKVNRK